ncbi:hypothetical protein [Bradyrhizobium pachyrhizi]|uniref:hypothetical protein n=1 Tax=Bradyrhizobium pachyrhizi TaxID=280333 RepID=UPI0012E3478E|nr:hypothetical protein [Bradyrhizobium pachyrhizi]
MRNPVSKMGDSHSREPIFGPAAGSFFVQLAALAVALGLVFAVLALGVFTKDEAHRLLFGKPSHARPTLEPGQSTTIDGVKIKRIN